MVANIFCQITQNFDDVVALACSPRPSLPSSREPSLPGWIYFEYSEDHSNWARWRYRSSTVIYNLKSRDPYFSFTISHLTYSDVLHVILAVFQNKPLSMEFFAMKKVLELDLEVKDLPQSLKVKAEKENISAWLDQF